MRLIDADAMLLRVDMKGTNQFGMLDEDIREFISEQPTVDIEAASSVDWSKVPVDEPILVRDSENTPWKHRYFAKYENNRVYAWDGGATSWSAENNYANTTDWVYGKLAEESEQR